MREYVTPDFDVTVYEVEDIITTSALQIGPNDPDTVIPDNQWWGH